MNTVKRAIILAAGKGNRLRPVTLTTPKPLVKVNGVRMIDSILQALHKNGIREIYVVVGYLKEQFSSLPAEYPGLTLIENPDFDTCNNISSLYAAREHLEDAILLDGDLLIQNPKILSPDFEKSGYNAIWTDKETSEWLMTVENGTVISCDTNGGHSGWQLFSVSRWNSEDGKRLKQQVEVEFERGNRQIYWDNVPMTLYLKDYKLGIYPMQPEDVLEIDSLQELLAQDSSYYLYEENVK